MCLQYALQSNCLKGQHRNSKGSKIPKQFRIFVETDKVSKHLHDIYKESAKRLLHMQDMHSLVD